MYVAFSNNFRIFFNDNFRIIFFQVSKYIRRIKYNKIKFLPKLHLYKAIYGLTILSH